MKDYRIQLFRDNFQDKEEPLVFYGIGIIARRLLSELVDYNIVGLLDKSKDKGELLGIPILNLEEVYKLGVKKIIIAASQRYNAVIYRRIAPFCNPKGITVYDLGGQELSKIYDLYEADIPYFHRNWKEMYALIEKHEIISFDIFDTLLVRKVCYPNTIFKIMEKKIRKAGFKISAFSTIRTESQKELEKVQGSPDIYAIYDEIQRRTRICDEDKRALVNMEIETEKSFIQPRASMLHFFNKIKQYKTIYLVSNMYLTKKILKDILKNCGYTGYRDILVSCEYGKGKSDGLFNILIDRVDNPADSILHIGDSPVMDDIEPQKLGINTFPIMSLLDMTLNSSYASLLKFGTTILNQIALGYFMKVAFDDPFALFETRGRLKINKLETYVDMFLNPLVLFFALWILKEAKKIEAEYILYLSRDAYLLEQVNNIIVKNQKLKEAVSGSYFYASRRATLLAAVYDENDAEELARYASFKGSATDLFSIRFGIQIDEKEGSNEFKEDNIQYYIKKYKDDILRSSRQQRENYETYINKMNLGQVKYIAAVEQHGYGAIQRGLSKIMNEKKIHGLFLKNIPGLINPGECSSFFPVNDGARLRDNFVIVNMILEGFLSSPEPSLHSFDKEGSPIFEEEPRSAQQLNDLDKMYSYALRYCDEISYICPDIIEEDTDWQLVNTIFGFLDEKYSVIYIKEFADMILQDNFGQNSVISMIEE